MKSRIILITFLVFATGRMFAHSYFVSTANMEYDAVTKSMEVSLKMTAHDFEHILENKFVQRIHIENVADTSEIGLFIQAYLKEHFVITSGGEQPLFGYVGKEVTLRDELFFYITFSGIKDPETIQIKNTLLFTEFPQQQNIVHYKWGERAKSVTLVAAKPEAELKLD
ncbi:MAG: hypothetical protein HYZ14_10650 [Bacteroidetes bacterium]|nr:hypothetical protein [Bacteroidota bacterium]